MVKRCRVVGWHPLLDPPSCLIFFLGCHPFTANISESDPDWLPCVSNSTIIADSLPTKGTGADVNVPEKTLLTEYWWVGWGCRKQFGPAEGVIPDKDRSLDTPRCDWRDENATGTLVCRHTDITEQKCKQSLSFNNATKRKQIHALLLNQNNSHRNRFLSREQIIHFNEASTRPTEATNLVTVRSVVE